MGISSFKFVHHISNNRPSVEQFFKKYDIGWFLKSDKEWENCLKSIFLNEEK